MSKKNTLCKYHHGGQEKCLRGKKCRFLHEKVIDDSSLDELECSMNHPWIFTNDKNRHIMQKDIEQKQEVLIGSAQAYAKLKDLNYRAFNWTIQMLQDQPVLLCTDVENKANLFDIENDRADITDMSCRMAHLSQVLLEFITIPDAGKPSISFTDQFRLELTPVGVHDQNASEAIRDQWELRLNLDPVAWFDKKWRDAKTEVEKTDFLIKAREYVEKYRHFVEEEFLEPSVHEPITPPRYSDYQASCINSKTYGYLEHAPLVCDNAMLHRTNGKRPCSQYFFDELVVMDWPVINCLTKRFHSKDTDLGQNFDWDTTRFIFQAKTETVRDLVLFPMPPWSLSNKQLVRLPMFWEHAILLCRLLRDELSKRYEQKAITRNSWCVDSIALNFGRWETAESEDKRVVDGHGHAHFLLTLAFVEQCDDTFFRTVKGRQEAPTNYYRQNVELLEKERLTNYEMKQHQAAMRKLESKLDETNALLTQTLAKLGNSSSNKNDS